MTLSSRYVEEPPAFAADYEGVIIVIDALISRSSPWERVANSERVAALLRENGIHVSLHGLGVRDPLELVSGIIALEPTLRAKSTQSLEDAETRWALSGDRDPAAGLRELVRHLLASGRRVILATALAEGVGRQVARGTLDPTGSLDVIGRTSTQNLSQTYEDVLRRARALVGAGRVSCVLTHRRAAISIYPVAQGDAVISVGPAPSNDSSEQLDIIDLASQCVLTAAERVDIDKRIVRRNRVRELQAQRTLTNDEMAEYTDLTGGVRLIGNAGMFGYVDAEKGSDNVRVLQYLRAGAAQQQHVLEVLAIEATLMEVQLRNWLIVHHGQIFTESERITFGQLVARAEGFGFAPALVERLRTFNQLRNDAVHHLSRGICTYAELTDRFMADCALLLDVEDFVLEASPVIGRPAEQY